LDWGEAASPGFKVWFKLQFCVREHRGMKGKAGAAHCRR
jgi:hypothetical protein